RCANRCRAVRIKELETAKLRIDPHAIEWMRRISRLDPNPLQWLAVQCWNKSVRHRSLPAETPILLERALVWRRPGTVSARNLVRRSDSSRSDSADSLAHVTGQVL